MEELPQVTDATHVAAQLGRLDLVSLLLAIIGVVWLLGGVFAFLNFRAIAKKQATDEATKIAEEVAERETKTIAKKVAKEIAKDVARRVAEDYMRENYKNVAAGHRVYGQKREPRGGVSGAGADEEAGSEGGEKR